MVVNRLIYTCIFATATFDLAFFISMFILLAKGNLQIYHEIFHFSFGGSVFDLVILSLTRFCLLVGVGFGMMINRTAASHRIVYIKNLVKYYGCFQAIYAVMKILFFTVDSCNDLPLRVWIMLSFTLVMAVGTYVCFKLLYASNGRHSKLKLNVNTEVSSTTSDDHDDCDDDDDDEDSCKMNPADTKEARKLSSSSTFIKLLKLAKNDFGYILIGFLFLVACSVSETFLPYYSGLVLNYIIIDKSEEKFNEAMLYMAGIALLAGFAAGIRGGLLTYILGRYTLRLQNTLFSSIIRMEIGFFDVRKTGEITSRLTSDCTKIGDGIGMNLNIFLRNIVKIIGILVFMIKLSWKLSIVSLITMPVIAIISEVFGDQYRKVSEKVQNSLAFANASAEEAISSVRTVRSFAGEENEELRYANRLKKTLGLRKREGIIIAGYYWCVEIADLVMALLILFYGGHLVILKDLSAGHLISFILYSFELGGAIEDIGDVYTGLMEVVGAAKNVCLYIDRKPLVENRGTLCPKEGIDGHIEFRDVTFAYPCREDIKVLKSVSFSAKKGEMVALVGPSGGGKTSVVNLLQHFYEPKEGEILIDGKLVQDYDHKFLHEKMSLVQQEPTLFARTLYENIAYGLQCEFSDKDIQHSAMLSNAHTFITEMPSEYHTETGEKGVQLSGGQKQRVAIARALIRNPTILILDEATSALDSESEHLVQQAINRNSSGRTVIVIAHRLSTIERADKILVIEKGEIVEVGKHQELIDRGGRYALLVNRQLLGTGEEDIPVRREQIDSLGSISSCSSSVSSSLKSNIKV